MHGLKSAILAIFQISADWLDWPCPVSAALQNDSQDFFPSLLYSNLNLFFTYETIVIHCAAYKLKGFLVLFLVGKRLNIFPGPSYLSFLAMTS